LDKQNLKLVCASGASSLGKTHLAYSIGKIYHCILIRIITPGQLDQLSGPWALAERFLNHFQSRITENENFDELCEIAKEAVKVVQFYSKYHYWQCNVAKRKINKRKLC
jgi:hypothetical protein